MYEYLNSILNEEEMAFSRIKFKGKLAGRSWKYQQQLVGIARSRIFIFLAVFFILYPAVVTWLVQVDFPTDVILERSIMAIITLIGGLLFNTYRIASIIIAVIPYSLIVLGRIFYLGNFGIIHTGFNIVVIAMILSGIYHHLKSNKLRKELEVYAIENRLIDDQEN